MISIALLIFTITYSIYAMNRSDIKYKYIFHPYSINHFNQHYRFLSHAFIHGDYIHLAFNMYALLMFGPIIENEIFPYLLGSYDEPNQKLGSLFFIIMYTGAIYASSISEYFKNKNNQSYSSLGASGAINSLIFSFIIFAPTAQLGFFFIPMPAWVFGVLYLGITFYLSKRNTSIASVDRIGHEAHFWGAIFGILFTIALKPDLFFNFIQNIFR
jgi:membrane associated rhomboid family serine protease